MGMGTSTKHVANLTHIPGLENVLADLRSRKFKDHLEWKLNKHIFVQICHKWGTPEIAMFASRLNRQLKKYVSWKPEPGSWATDALTLRWGNKYIINMFQPTTTGSEEDREGWSIGDCGGTTLADTTMTPATAGEGNSTAEVPQTTWEPIWSQSRKPRKQARGAKRHKIDVLPLLVRTLEEYNIDNKALQFFKFSWRPFTRKNCYTYKKVGPMGT